MVPRISQVQSTVRITKKLRFNVTANLSAAITRGNLLNLIALATTTSVSYRLIDAIRIVSVEMWGEDPAFAAAATSVVLEWVSEDGPNVTTSCQSAATQPAYLKSRPPARSLAGFWSDSGYDEATELMSLTAPIGSTIDLTVELCLPQQKGGVAGPTSAAHLVVGTLYWVPIDGSTGVAKPVDQTVFIP